MVLDRGRETGGAHTDVWGILLSVYNVFFSSCSWKGWDGIGPSRDQLSVPRSTCPSPERHSKGYLSLLSLRFPIIPVPSEIQGDLMAMIKNKKSHARLVPTFPLDPQNVPLPSQLSSILPGRE